MYYDNMHLVVVVAFTRLLARRECINLLDLESSQKTMMFWVLSKSDQSARRHHCRRPGTSPKPSKLIEYGQNPTFKRIGDNKSIARKGTVGSQQDYFAYQIVKNCLDRFGKTRCQIKLC